MTATAFESATAQNVIDPYASGAPGSSWWDRTPQPQENEYLRPPSSPTQRVDVAIGPRDRRRLDLHAALTTAGVPPQFDDREAIDQLSALPDSINATIQRWIHHTTRAWSAT